MRAFIPVLLAAFVGLASATEVPEATKFDVTNIDSIEDLFGAPNPGKLARREMSSGLVKRQGPNRPRLLNCHGVMQIKDDEPWFQGDDYFTRTRDMEFTLGVSNVHTRTFNWVERAGGEIRIELLLTATLNPNTGAVTLNHDTKLFEGTSTDTGDLDGRGSGSMVIAKNAQRAMGFTVHNTAEGGDWVKATITCTNGKVR